MKTPENPLEKEEQVVKETLEILMAWYIGHRRPATASELARGIGWPLDRVKKMLHLAYHLSENEVDVQTVGWNEKKVYSPSKLHILDHYLKARGENP